MHCAHCATTVIRYPFVSIPLGASDETIQAARVNPWQFPQINHVVSTQVLLPLLAKSRTRTQQVRDSLLIFSSLQFLQKSLARYARPNALRMRTHNAMPRNDIDNHTEHASLKFKSTHCVLLIQPWAFFYDPFYQAAHLLLTESTTTLSILIAAWLSESMVNVPLGDPPDPNNSHRSLYCHHLHQKDTAAKAGLLQLIPKKFHCQQLQKLLIKKWNLFWISGITIVNRGNV